MLDDDRLWSLLAELEARLPLRQDALEAFFATTFETSRDHNRQPILIAKTASYEIELRPAIDLSVVFAPPLNVSSSAIRQRFPDGQSQPPPPPSWGPADAAGSYLADRPWGQIWFALLTGDRLMRISILPGVHHSPGV